uniref:Uncharacterized protein n=1 Tax=Cacopsylla melanoneura TaxID=428564 RepID=A0A8D8TBC9_9HEMI
MHRVLEIARIRNSRLVRLLIFRRLVAPARLARVFRAAPLAMLLVGPILRLGFFGQGLHVDRRAPVAALTDQGGRLPARPTETVIAGESHGWGGGLILVVRHDGAGGSSAAPQSPFLFPMIRTSLLTWVIHWHTQTLFATNTSQIIN